MKENIKIHRRPAKIGKYRLINVPIDLSKIDQEDHDICPAFGCAEVDEKGKLSHTYMSIRCARELGVEYTTWHMGLCANEKYARVWIEEPTKT